MNQRGKRRPRSPRASRPRWWVWPALWVLGLSAPASRADESPFSAQDVVDAARKNDQARLREFAAHEDPDAWIVADELLAIGEGAAASAFAKAVPAERGAALVRYLASHATAAGDAAARAAFRAAGEDVEAARPASALKDLAPAEAVPAAGTLLSVRLHELRGRAHGALKQRSQAGDEFGRAASEAAALGWTRFARDALDAAIDAYYRTYLFDACRDRIQDRRDMQDAAGDAKGVAESDRDLGSVEEGRGDYARALQRFESARAGFESLGLRSQTLMAVAYAGAVRREMGDYAGAMLAFEEVERGRSAASLSVGEEAEVLSGRALLQRDLGDVRAARELLQSAREGFLKAEDPQGEAQAVGNLGLMELDDGRWAEARRRLEEASAIFERLDEPKDVADALLNLGYVSLGAARRVRAAPEGASSPAPDARAREVSDHVETALARFRAALAEQEKHGLAAGTTLTRGAIGEALLEQGRVPAAVQEFERARDEADRLKLNQEYVEMLSWLARAHFAAGTVSGREEAVRYARIVVRETTRLYLGLPEDFRARARTRQADAFDTGAMAAAALGRVDDLAYFLEAGRAASLLQALGGRIAARYATVPAEVRAATETAARNRASAYARLQQARGAGARDVIAERGAAYDAARESEREALERVRRVEEAGAARLESPRLESVADLQRRLGPGDVLVLYGLFAKEAWAVVADAAGARIVSLHDPAEGTEPIRRAVERIGAGGAGTSDPEAIARLRALLLDPLRIPATAKRLLICPDAELCYVPMSLLVPADLEVVFEPSGTLWRLLLDDARMSGKGVLAVGDPVTAPAGPEVRLRGGDLARLRGSGDEVRAVAHGEGDVPLLREAATKSRIRKELAARGDKNRWRSIHFACHGVIDVERPTFSALALSSGDGDDGLLTALEVFRWRMPTDLAVLSACSTARGRFLHGEGIIGLTRAFMYAGAPRVLVSLWDVDDLATQALMTEFYARWNAGSAPAKALREAQRALRTGQYAAWAPPKPAGGAGPAKAPDWSDPRYWAAWALWGLPE